MQKTRTFLGGVISTSLFQLFIATCLFTNFVINIVGKSRKIPFSFTDIAHCHESFTVHCIPAFSLVRGM